VKLRPLYLAPALVALGLSQAACSSLSRPEEITISAEPARAAKKEAPPPPPQPAAPAPAAAAPAPAAAGG
jgi:hypothetical protein